MTLIMATAPGSASTTFTLQLENYFNCKAKCLKTGQGGIGHLFLNISKKDEILNKLNLNFLRKKETLIYGHIFPTKYNLNLLNKFYKFNKILITYRNIFEQLNYYYKWQKKNFTGPLNFVEDMEITKNYTFNNNSFNVDLTLLLTLNFYKHWFYLIQNNKIKNYVFFSYNEIISLNDDYKKKISDLMTKNLNKLNFDENIKDNLYKKENFEIHTRHKDMIYEFISYHKNIDFSMIL